MDFMIMLHQNNGPFKQVCLSYLFLLSINAFAVLCVTRIIDISNTFVLVCNNLFLYSVNAVRDCVSAGSI